MAIKTGTISNGKIKEIVEKLTKLSHDEMVGEKELKGIHKGKGVHGPFVIATFKDDTFGYIPNLSLDYFDEYTEEDNAEIEAGNYKLVTKKEKSKAGKDYFVSFVEI